VSRSERSILVRTCAAMSYPPREAKIEHGFDRTSVRCLPLGTDKNRDPSGVSLEQVFDLLVEAGYGQ
jgi:hypothetical protein